MRDEAAFRKTDVDRVYGPRHVCFITGKDQTMGEPVDGHHILGRVLDGGRKAASSVLNLSWLRRDIHGGPARDRRSMRIALLEIAAEKVFNAIGQRRYRLREEDYTFMRHVEREGLFDYGLAHVAEAGASPV